MAGETESVVDGGEVDGEAAVGLAMPRVIDIDGALVGGLRKLFREIRRRLEERSGADNVVRHVRHRFCEHKSRACVGELLSIVGYAASLLKERCGAAANALDCAEQCHDLHLFCRQHGGNLLRKPQWGGKTKILEDAAAQGGGEVRVAVEEAWVDGLAPGRKSCRQSGRREQPHRRGRMAAMMPLSSMAIAPS